MSIDGIIAGLGNPGKQYEKTRHNIGFMAIDELIGLTSASKHSEKFRCELWKMRIPHISGEWLLAKPKTYMNLSGDALQPLAAWYTIPANHIFVIHDELDLPLGKMKLKQGGGTAGHNGLKSITQRLGTTNIYRLRVGIGRSPYPSNDTTSWVLGKLSQQELTVCYDLFPTIFEVVSLFIKGDISKATTLTNSFTLPV